jgi:hypothetical protein
LRPSNKPTGRFELQQREASYRLGVLKELAGSDHDLAPLVHLHYSKVSTRLPTQSSRGTKAKGQATVLLHNRSATNITASHYGIRRHPPPLSFIFFLLSVHKPRDQLVSSDLSNGQPNILQFTDSTRTNLDQVLPIRTRQDDRRIETWSLPHQNQQDIATDQLKTPARPRVLSNLGIPTPNDRTAAFFPAKPKRSSRLSVTSHAHRPINWCVREATRR